jgi:hypothetical protein
VAVELSHWHARVPDDETQSQGSKRERKERKEEENKQNK